MEIQKALRVSKRQKLSTGKGLTEQHHKDACNINLILQDYQRTGFLRHRKNQQGVYADVECQDFQQAMQIVTEAQRMFSELPAAIRKRFDHDPGQFLEFVNDPENAEEAEKLGIIKVKGNVDVSGTAEVAPLKEDVQKAKLEGVSEETPKASTST